MKNIPTITINNPNKPININVPNTGVTGNKFVNWSGGNNQFIQSSINNNLGNLNIPNINVPNINSSGSGGGSVLTTPFTQYVSKTPAYTAQEMVGWLEHTNNTQNLQFNLPYKEINLSGKSVTDEDMVFFAQRMSNFAFHLDSLQLNHNPISDYGIQALFNCAFTVPLGRSVVHLKLNNCNFGDVGAELIAAYVRDGYMPATRVIDVSGNKITEVGQDFFVRALNDPIVKRLAILIDDLSHNLRIQSGIKEDVVAELHSILKSAKNRGVDVDNLVVDTSFFTWAKNIKGSVKLATKGFIKCKWVDDPIGDHVKADLCDKLPDKIGKPLKKIIDVESTVSCFISSYDQAKTSEFGAQIAITDLHVIGEDYIPENIE